MILYIAIGVVTTIFMIWNYREDGTTDRTGELYWASIGFIIWPLLIIKFIMDWTKEK